MACFRHIKHLQNLPIQTHFADSLKTKPRGQTNKRFFLKMVRNKVMAEEIERYESLLGILSGKTGIKKETLEMRIKEKQEKFAGVLNKLGALYMVAKEESIDLGAERLKEKISLAEIEPEMQDIEIEAIVSKVFQPKAYSKNSRSGTLCSILIEDGKTTSRLTVWNDAVMEIEEMGISQGDKIRISGASSSVYKDSLQLSLGKGGRIELIEKGKNSPAKINSLKEDMDNVTVHGRVMKAYGTKSSTGKNGPYTLSNFVLADETGSIRATAWNDRATAMANFREGSGIKIEGAYTKKGLNGTELHLGWTSRVTASKDAPEIEEQANAERAEIGDIEKMQGKKVAITGIITEMDTRHFSYYSSNGNFLR